MYFFVIISTLFVPFFIFSMDTDNAHIRYCRASENDLSQILKLYEIANQHENDKKKIVILPHEIRADALKSAIAQKRIFIAKNGDIVIGFKKVYTIDDPKELREILEQELRFTENKTILITQISEHTQTINTHLTTTYHFMRNATYLYNGSDFTHPAYRGKGINRALSCDAFKTLLEENQHPAILKMIFGLTKYNAEDNPSKGCNDRLPGVAKLFAQSIRKTYQPQSPIVLEHAKTTAYMPVFTVKNGTVLMSSDSESIEGCGNILTYTHQ